MALLRSAVLPSLIKLLGPKLEEQVHAFRSTVPLVYRLENRGEGAVEDKSNETVWRICLRAGYIH